MLEGIEERVVAEVESMIVRQIHAINSQLREHVQGDRRGTKVERLMRICPSLAPVRDATFEI
jgi:hypothetical protein